MIDIVALWAGAATIGCGALTFLWLNCRIDRDESRADLRREEQVVEALENRVKVLRADNADLQKQLIEATREAGRIKAEKVAMKPKRGPDGRFVSKKPKPIACA